ncbi:MAG: 4-hydroxy-tetrahydrodipicolinate synthase [Deltaproteobacteria bacterium RIFCSPLOWO2_02_FULL_50_16]|nr:MAG: 4-hydroxy-tetrahydrodipicolinate synthase [Deltaproteobacteria bacterium GWA2_50_8]OGQ30619.1 MAG: 4-hydroxy-tetrahydrodipicolinate synthase [Deltaproteobacteria bacterium RIFCSPHIGHO2_02_FULL_50_15]OGQ58041.1 MAG: 4-hydroxy-tetrahydrodipicolinate synthase [Deltaproteobacteria bacterium RIFCSPLOWO2_02_FULL_50_16]OGQ67120.1 MAG: 4-hydroxy-tetrahydrodipicolinate synthase [Deltaproteobacteria bacterium RIFCSPLOWO2_12_FULL_50_11]
MFQGSFVAIVTPFKNNEIDEPALRNLIDWHIQSGTDGIVPCGTTGESATLSHEEHNRVVRITVEQVNKRIKVLAGTGSNATSEALRMTRNAKEAGADGCLLITPYYNKPTQEGLFRHFEAIAKAVDIPLILYNVPGRTAVNMLPLTVKRCATLSNIIGIKEASGDLDQIRDIIKFCGPDFLILSGEDAQNHAIMKLGGKGVISVTANCLPSRVADLCRQCLKKNDAAAEKIQDELSEINDVLFIETNPIPIKTAMALMGKVREEFRLPLCPMGEKNKKQLEAVLKKYELM